MSNSNTATPSSAAQEVDLSKKKIIDAMEAEERVRIMLDATPLCCNFWDKDFNNIDCNQEAANLFGLANKQEYLDNFFQLSPEFQPDGRPSAEKAGEHITKAFKDGYEKFEWMHQKLDGTPMPSEVTLVRVEWRGEYIVAGYTRDLRELKAAQLELDKERLLLKQVLDSSPVCLTIVVEGIIRFATPFTTQFLGAEVGDHISKYYLQSSDYLEFMHNVKKDNTFNWVPVTIKTESGEIKKMLANAFYADYYKEQAVMIWFMDVTEIREQEQELRLARDAAEESTRTKSDFLANMSHEIRTPMNAILGMSHLILLTDLTPKQRGYIEKSEQATKALLRIINDILDFSKIEANKLEMEAIDFSLEHVLRGISDITIDKAHEKGLEFNLSVAAGVPATLKGDPLRLSQVLLNLTSNALKFTKDGSITLSVEIKEQGSGFLNLGFFVRDTGIGIKNEQLQNMFSSFSQADTSTTRQYGGTGLGLAISKSLVELMGGEIWCESEIGTGSTFYFTAQFDVPEQQVLDQNRSCMNKLRVMITGDNLESIKILQESLNSMGCLVSVDLSANLAAVTCAEMAKLVPFDCVIMDWHKPEIDGVEAVNRFRGCFDSNNPSIPPILMGVFPHEHESVASIHAIGIYHLIEKPMLPSALFDSIATAINAKETTQNSTNNALANTIGLVINDAPKDLAEEFASLRGAHVLLTEDNETNQMIAEELLENVGIIVDIANNGREAVDKVLVGNYDLVLMDIQMPVMDGILAATEIRKDKRFDSLPILAMTAHAMTGDKDKSLQAGMNDHVTKPIDVISLYTTLARWIKK